MPSCVIRECKNYSEKHQKKSGITFHLFPRNEFRRNKWIELIRRERRDESWDPTPHSVICSRHFNKQDFYLTSKGFHRLSRNASPSLQLPTNNLPTYTTYKENLFMHKTQEFEHKMVNIKKRLKKSQMKKISLNDNLIRIKNNNIKFMAILEDLKEKNIIGEDIYSKLINHVQTGDMYKRNVIINKKKVVKFSNHLRKFALTLNYFFPKAYRYARGAFGNCLPRPRTLHKWYENIKFDPGFTSNALETLKLKAGDNYLICNLVFHEMAISQEDIWSGRERVGTVDVFDPQENSEMASQVLVFMLVSYTDEWKLPVGFFFINSLSAEQKANLLKICLQKCHDSNVKVVSVTFEGTTTNFSAAKLLGCRLDDYHLKVSFPHPSTKEEVVIFPDPGHLVKLIRNTFQCKYVIFDANSSPIKWEYLVNLQKLQEQEHFNLGDNSSESQMLFKYQIMNVELSTQFFSRSVGDILNYCESQLKMEEFRGCSHTADFIYIISTMLDIFNSRIGYQSFKEPLSHQNRDTTFEFLDIAKSYLLTLSTIHCQKRITKWKSRNPEVNILKVRKPLVESQRKTGFLGIIVCIESTKLLYSRLVQTSIIDKIPFYNLSQERLELYFTLIRQNGESNSYPNAAQFKHIYRRTLLQLMTI